MPSQPSVLEVQPPIRGTKEVALVPPSLAVGGDLVLMFERLAKDPAVDVGKLEKLIDLQLGIIRVNAKAAFDAAFSAMQPEIPEIDERGRILNKSGQVQSQYAKFEDIQKVIKPILTRHWFSLRFKTSYPGDGIRTLVTGILGFGGHEETTQFLSDPDDSGGKNKIQGLGSANSYGRRYTTIDLLNITTRGADDDGQSSDRHKEPAAPDGFESWWLDMEALTDNGLKALSDSWGKSKSEFKNYTAKNRQREWEVLKAKARGVKVGISGS